MSEHRQEVIVPSASDLSAQVAQAIQDDTLPEFHFNGFINVLTSGDVLIILQRNGRNIVKLTASYTVSKTLAQKLAQAIVDLEQRTGNTIMTTDDVQQASQHEEPQ